jgi:hypothetical protein
MATDLTWVNLFKVYELVRDDETKPASNRQDGLGFRERAVRLQSLCESA